MIKLILGDALQELNAIPDNTVDLVLTDPPYFYKKLDDNWSHEKISKDMGGGIVKHLPGGMRFSADQSRRFASWFAPFAEKIYRILKPGGWFISFFSPRLFHRFVCVAEDQGFWIRDMFIWIHPLSQPKAFSLKKFAEKFSEEIKAELEKYKVPMVKPVFDPIMIAQKPPEGTLLENFVKYKVGLFNVGVKQGDGKFPSNVITTEPINSILDKYFIVNREKKDRGNDHPTVKPLSITKFLIELTTKELAVVVDPFMGSGTTAVACASLNRNFIGIEIDRHYFEIAVRRTKSVSDNIDVKE